MQHSDILVGKGERPQMLHLPLANRHGLIAGATGTGKTVTLQVLAEGFSRAGVSVFCADIKGDLAGISQAGKPNAKMEQRAAELGSAAYAYEAAPVIFWDVFGQQGHPVRATVSAMGPVLLSRMLELNETQEGVVTIAFAVADHEGLVLLDFKDLRAILGHVGERAAELTTVYGNISKSSVGTIQRKLLALEQAGGAAFFGEPALLLTDLMRISPDGRGAVNVLAADRLIQSPRLYATFLLWLMSELYHQLPEVGDLDKPKLVFFFDEAHLLFRDASRAFLDQVEQVVRLVRSKGVGIFFVTQNPKDVPTELLGQLGNRVQHALRAFTPDDEKALRAAARTFPRTPFYDVQQTLTTLGIGEALVTVLGENGAPSPPFVARIAAPASRMGPLTPAEIAPLLQTEQVRRYAAAVDRESAYEILGQRLEPDEAPATAAPTPPSKPASPAKKTASAWTEALRSPVARTIANQVTRGLMGALLGPPRRRRRTRPAW